MSKEDSLDEAIDVLKQLGLKEYEAKCFVGLSRLPSGTAKQLSEITDVPRTRIYDAIRVLEARGLVEIQHSSPQRFRAVPLEEARETLRAQYEDRIERFAGALESAEPIDPDDEESIQEVWALNGSVAIANRTSQLLDKAAEEVVLVVGDGSIMSDDLVEQLNGLGAQTDLLIGAIDQSLRDEIERSVPEARTFVSGLDWLRGRGDEEVAMGRLLLVDRSTILVSSLVPDSGEEHAVFGTGFRNGLILLSRRLMAQGLVGGDAQ